VTGLSDNNSTEIISGLAEGEQIVTRIITASKTTAAAKPATSLLGATGVRTGGGGAGTGGYRGQ
jgi:hypothetical protein